MKFVRLHPDAQLPTRKTDGAAGYDLHCIGDHIVGDLATIPTGVGVQIPDGWVGLIRDRSGLAATLGLTTLAGVIDCDYTGEIKVIATCTHPSCAPLIHGERIAPLMHGERIAQLIIVPALMESSEWTDDLITTKRGARGFGSTGV